MKNIRLIIIIIVLVLVASAAGYFFWTMPNPTPKPVKHPKAKPTPAGPISVDTTPKVNIPPTISKSTSIVTTLSTNTTTSTGTTESPFEFHQYSTDSGGVPYVKDTGYRGIGERDLFCLLIPPPPPPPPHKITTADKTRNWKLWEIVDENECVIADARPLNHNLHIGEQLEGVAVVKIVTAEDKVELASVDNKEDVVWKQLDSIANITKGWKVAGTIPSLKKAIIITGDNVRHTVKEGEVIQHCTLKKVSQGKVTLTYGTMSTDL